MSHPGGATDSATSGAGRSGRPHAPVGIALVTGVGVDAIAADAKPSP